MRTSVAAARKRPRANRWAPQEGVGQIEGGEGHPQIGHAVEAERSGISLRNADAGSVEIGNHRQRKSEGKHAVANVSGSSGGGRGMSEFSAVPVQNNGADRNTVQAMGQGKRKSWCVRRFCLPDGRSCDTVRVASQCFFGGPTCTGSNGHRTPPADVVISRFGRTASDGNRHPRTCLVRG